MPPGLQVVAQEDFSAGAFPLNERVPRNGVESLVNGFYADDGSIYKRGGVAYKSNANTGAITALWDGKLLAGNRTVFTAEQDLYILNPSDDATPQLIATLTSTTDPRLSRPVAVGGLLALNGRQFFGGSNKTAYSTGTVTTTLGSKTVTGVGTTWTGNVEAGMLITGPGANSYAVVESVESNTSLTLTYPWPWTALAGSAYVIDRTVEIAWNYPSSSVVTHVAAVGSLPRLAVSHGPRVSFSPAGEPLNFSQDTDYHQTQDGSTVTGLEGVADSLLIFSESGMSVVHNMSYDLTDALGNVQQTMTREGRQVILWDNNGIAQWRGAVVIPGIDDVYLYAGGQLEPISGPVRTLIRRRARQGYKLGIATVFGDHYLLPVLNPSGVWVETHVCRLDARAWSQVDGEESTCFATRVASTGAKLYGASGVRVLDATGFFNPSAANKADANGGTPTWKATLRTTTPRQGVATQVRWARVRAELDDAASDNPTITAEWAPGRPGSSFTSLTGAMTENAGDTPKKWRVEKRGVEGRLRLTSVGPSASLVLRSVEMAFRPNGRA